MEIGRLSVSLKGTSEGLAIVIPEEMEFENAINELKNKIEAAGKFFTGASFKVVYRGKFLNDEQEQRVYNLLKDESGAVIESFEREEPKNDKPTIGEGYITKTNALYFKDLEEGACKFIRRTLRGGASVKFNGNIVILGDVNPGAEVIATGNIVVMGTLRGVVHAGADGNKDATVSSIKLKPSQIRIADVITRFPDNKTDDIDPEIAFVKDGKIYVDTIV